jgi:hypothetical protein
MARKRWTPKTEINDSLIQSREKRKWQIALRRYVLEQNKSSFYAPYFGLDHTMFRKWIELQFIDGLAWENFSSHWQFDHIVPVAYFDFTNVTDLRLCWNFVNIRIEKSNLTKNRAAGIDVIAAKKHFEVLFQETGYQVCKDMLDKISRIEVSELVGNMALHQFINANKEYLDAVKAFDSTDFDRLNTGTSLKALLSEKDFIKRLQ